MPDSTASHLLGPTPGPLLRPISLAVRRYLQDAIWSGRKPVQPAPVRAGLVIAVSGGADSLALAVAALDLARRWNLPTRTVTVDHGVRAESAGEASQVAALLRELGATEAVVESGDLGGGAGGPEANARDLRYGHLFESTRSFAADQGLEQVELLLGHTMDDQAETVLLRLARGAGTSLGAIRRRQPLPEAGPAGTGAWWGRPLLGVRRADTENFCRALDLPIVEDPSNRTDGPWRTKTGEPLRRSAVREWALPALARALGQDVAPALARTATQLQEDDQALQEWATDTVALALVSPASAKGERYEVSELARVPAAVRKRALRRIALDSGVRAGDLVAVHLGFLDALIADWHGQGPVTLPGGILIWRVGGHLHVEKSVPKTGR